MTEERVGRRWVRWIVWFAAGFVVLAVVLAVAVHTPPVRRYALRRAISTLQENAGIRLHAEDLAYNLFALRVTLRDVRVSAETSAEAPFFRAERVAVSIPRSAVFGPLTIESIHVEGGRVHVTRAADGGTNLPESEGGEGTPDPLPVDSLVMPRLAFQFSDAANDIAVALPAIDLDVNRNDGRIELLERGRLRRRQLTTDIRTFKSGITFDGRSLALSALELRTDDLALTGDGTIRILVEEPSVELHLAGEGDASRLARWADIDDAPRGEVNVAANISGPFSAMTANVKLQARTIQWRDTIATDVSASLRATRDHLQVQQFDAQVFRGRIAAAGDVPLAGGDSHFTASWAAIDLEALMRAVTVDLNPKPTGLATGRLQARGSGTDLQRWVIDATTQTTSGVTSRNRVALGGTMDLHVEGGRWRLGADERVGGIPLQAALGGRVEAGRLEQSTVNGSVTLPPIATRAVVDFLRRTDLATVRIPPTGGMVQAKATISGTIKAPRVTAAGSATLDDVAALAPEAPLGGPAHVDFEATTTEARVQAVLPEFNARADATIVLRAPYNAEVVVEAPAVDLERLLRGIRTPVPLTGVVTARARATLPLEDWQRGRGSIEVTELNARAGALDVRLAAPALLAYGNETVDVRSLEILAGETRLSASGGLPLTTSSRVAGDLVTPAPSLQVTAVGDLAQFTSAVAATGMVEIPDVSGTGPAALLARVTGSLAHPRIVADLELGPGTLRAGDLPPASGVQLRAHSDGTWIELRHLTAEWQGSRIQASGRAPVEWTGVNIGPSVETGKGRASGRPDDPVGSLTARITSITPQVLVPFLDADTVSQIEGSVDASVSLQSRSLELQDVTGEVQLDRMDVRIADLPIAQRVPTRIALANGFARVMSWEWMGQGGTLGVQGRVRLLDQQAALLATGSFDLRMLTPFVRGAGITTAGTVAPRLSITGALADPRIDGDVTVSAGEIRLVDPRVIATSVAARATLTRTTAHVTQVAGFVNGGRLSGGGAIEFAPRAPLDARLSVQVDGMALEFPQGLRSELDVALGINVVLPAADVVTPSGSVTGTVTVLRSAYREPVAVVTGLLAALRTRQVAAAATPEPSLIDNLTLDVRVLTEDDVIVDNNLGRLELGTDIRVIGTVAAPSLAGRAQLREGGRLFFGRNIYVIERGSTIDFANPVTIEPDVNIQARTRAGGEDILLTLKGTPDNLVPEVDAPENPDITEADIYSLLLTGRLLDEVSGEEAQIVGEQVLGYLSGDVLGIASRAVGLDAIRLGGVDEELLRRDPSAIATELDPAARLTFGKSLGRSIDVTYSQSLRHSDAQTWIVDYLPLRNLEFRFVSDDDDLRSYEFRHDVSIGAAAAVSAEPRERPAVRGRQLLRVSGVTVRGNLALPERRVVAALGIKEGDEFDFSKWQRGRDRLEALYHGENYYEARVDAQRHENGTSVQLTYDINAGPRTQIAVSGFGLPDATLQRIRTAWSQSVVDEFLADEARAIVAGDLARQGYLQARVKVDLRLKPEATQPEALDPGSFRLQAEDRQSEEKTLGIRIDPGPRVPTSTVSIDIPDTALEDDVRAWLDLRGFTKSAATQPAVLERELTLYLRSRGYLRARVTVGAPAIEGTRAVVRVSVDSGPVFTVADVQFNGPARLPLETVRAASGLLAGAPFDPAAVDRARERLVARYRREGFPQARVEVSQVPREGAAAVALRFDIAEGPRQLVTEIDVQGNRAIDDDVITRALDLPLNEPLAGDAWLQARRRVFDTGLFRRVDVAAEATAPASSGADTVPMRARVTVQEWPALRLRYGFQVAEERPEGELEGRELVPGLSADLTRRTLFGRAVSLVAAFDYQRREQSGRAVATAPTMFGWPIESVVLLERARERFTAQTRVTDTTGLTLEQRFRLVDNLRLSYAYRFSRDHTFDTGEPDPIFGPLDITVRVARLNATAAFDTRDDPVDTTRGVLLSSSFDYAPAALGSQFRYVKHLAQAYSFRPWRAVVVASAARFGLAGALDDQELLLSERFTAGGARTVRGAAEDSLGPSSFFGPTGGEAVVVLNQEVRFPIYRWLGGVAFVDAGNVFARRSDLALGDLVGAGGFGLRLNTPFALLRVDYGRLFSPATGSRSGRWMFGIGQAF